MNNLAVFTKGILKENPIFVMLLGLCPTLGVTSSAMNGMGMGIATMFVLIMANASISLLKTQIPDNIRIPAYIVVIAAFVTCVQLLMEAFTPDLFTQLGVFIPLIVVNCVVLGRAEAFAAKNNVWSSLLDGAGMGLGFTIALTMLGGIREILGSGSIFDYKFITGDGILIFILAPGAFIALGFLIALINHLKIKKA
ncbi:MAG: electron transport complex subunit E [Bacteroidales bacterium]|jgi:electron transport complex protein RnfE|nr:electron transport complex subunit E [Bacteroidales bacterium]